MDVETEAQRIFEMNGFDPSDPPSMELLAYTIMGAKKVNRVHGLPVPARWRGSTDELQLRPGLTPQAESFLIAHELAERHFARLCFWNEFIERWADALAAALVVPGPALRFTTREHGRSLPTLAEIHQTTQSICILRLGEVFGSPLALVTPRNVHIRGEEFVWPPHQTIRAIAAGRELAPLRKVVLTDAPRHIGLMSA